MYSINYTNRFSKDLKRCKKRGLNIKLIQDALCYCLKQVHYQHNTTHIDYQATDKGNGIAIFNQIG